jgi:hypothetical protein
MCAACRVTPVSLGAFYGRHGRRSSVDLNAAAAEAHAHSQAEAEAEAEARADSAATIIGARHAIVSRRARHVERAMGANCVLDARIWLISHHQEAEYSQSPCVFHQNKTKKQNSGLSINDI